MNNGWMNGYNSKQFCKIIFLGYGRKLENFKCMQQFLQNVILMEIR